MDYHEPHIKVETLSIIFRS